VKNRRRSKTAASAIAELNPDARVVVIFREPAAFLRSFHLQLIQTHNESQYDLRQALALEADRRRGKHVPRRAHRPQLLHYSDHVCYADQLARYHAALPRENVLALIYEDFKADNVATVRQIFRFLGIDDTFCVTQLKANPTVVVRSQALDEAVHRYSVGRDPFSQIVKTGIKAVVPQRTRRTLLRTVQRRVVHAAPPPPDSSALADLRRSLRPEVERFSEYLDRDLVSLWGYGDV
jgi:Sulfotransferase family